MTEKINEKKKCFIITPIGGDETHIRRHIDGIIDAAIIPALGEEFEIIVAHRVNTPGSINKQVITSIFNSDLVIANLTELNPNVMYELAFRHSLRKPVITIMEKGNKPLPFDVSAERTIFYINDSKGVLDLRSSLEEAVKATLSLDLKSIDNPIYSALEGMIEENHVLENINKKDNEEVNALNYIMKRLDRIEENLTTDLTTKDVDTKTNSHKMQISFYDDHLLDEELRYEILNQITKKLYLPIVDPDKIIVRHTDTSMLIEIRSKINSGILRNFIREAVEETLINRKLEGVKFTVRIIIGGNV